MPGRIIEIAEDGRSIHLERGFLSIRASDGEIARVPLDDIECVLASAQGILWSSRALAALAERGVTVTVLGQNFAPISIVYPLAGHHAQGTRMVAQAEATRPTAKRLWSEIVRAKINA